MIKPLTYYTIICDNCGKDCNEDQEHTAWSTRSGAKSTADDSGWMTTHKQGTPAPKHYCPDCWGWDENDELLILKNEASNLHND